MKRLLISLLAVVICLGAQATAPVRPRQDKDIVDTMLTVDRFDTFLTLLREADLTFALKRSGPYTVFAPTNDAFNALGPAKIAAIRAHKSALRHLLMKHIVYGRHSAENSVRTGAIRNWAGGTLHFENYDGRGMVMGRAHFTDSNMRTTNGYIHAIDAVL